jgi:hypothetical protein
MQQLANRAPWITQPFAALVLQQSTSRNPEKEREMFEMFMMVGEWKERLGLSS